MARLKILSISEDEFVELITRKLEIEEELFTELEGNSFYKSKRLDRTLSYPNLAVVSVVKKDNAKSILNLINELRLVNNSLKSGCTIFDHDEVYECSFHGPIIHSTVIYLEVLVDTRYEDQFFSSKSILCSLGKIKTTIKKQLTDYLKDDANQELLQGNFDKLNIISSFVSDIKKHSGFKYRFVGAQPVTRESVVYKTRGANRKVKIPLSLGGDLSLVDDELAGENLKLTVNSLDRPIINGVYCEGLAEVLGLDGDIFRV